MSEPNPVEFLVDQLSPITRAERRNLLLASIIGVLVGKAGLIPTKISEFGITLSSPDQGTFVVVVFCTVIYFLCAFVIYGAADFFIWRKKYQDYLEHVDTYMERWSEQDQHNYEECHSRVPEIAWLYQRAKSVAFVRVFFEYALPIFTGLYSAIVLFLSA
jgi:hypothetical protein